MKEETNEENVCKNCSHFIWKHRDLKGDCRQFNKYPKRKCECEEFA